MVVGQISVFCWTMLRRSRSFVGASCRCPHRGAECSRRRHVRLGFRKSLDLACFPLLFCKNYLSSCCSTEDDDNDDQETNKIQEQAQEERTKQRRRRWRLRFSKWNSRRGNAATTIAVGQCRWWRERQRKTALFFFFFVVRTSLWINSNKLSAFDFVNCRFALVQRGIQLHIVHPSAGAISVALGGKFYQLRLTNDARLENRDWAFLAVRFRTVAAGRNDCLGGRRPQRRRGERSAGNAAVAVRERRQQVPRTVRD